MDFGTVENYARKFGVELSGYHSRVTDHYAVVLKKGSLSRTIRIDDYDLAQSDDPSGFVITKVLAECRDMTKRPDAVRRDRARARAFRSRTFRLCTKGITR